MTDAEIVARILDGDRDAFALLVARYYAECERFARRMLGNRQDAEDALQEGFLRAYRALGQYEDRDSFRGWLYRIVVNQCQTIATQRWRRDARFVHDDAAMAIAASDAEPFVADDDRLTRAVASLDPLLREAVLLRYGEDLTYPAMAVLTGASVSALKMRVRRACDALRPLLETEHDA